jgi:hypothetical protein
MEIYEALKNDHREVKDLLRQLVTLRETDSAIRENLIIHIRDALIPHSRAEETVFYNSLRAIDGAKDVVMHAYQEHIEAEALLRTLQVKEKIDMNWTETARKLKTALERHIEEEEVRVFNVAKQLFTKEEAEMMCEAFDKLKSEIREEGFMTTTLELVANLMPPRFAKAFSKFDLERRVESRS